MIDTLVREKLIPKVDLHLLCQIEVKLSFYEYLLKNKDDNNIKAKLNTSDVTQEYIKYLIVWSNIA